MIRLTIRLKNFDSTIRDFERAANALAGDMSRAFQRVRAEIWEETASLFGTSGRGTWAAWSAWTTIWRNERMDYYGSSPGPIEDNVGVWSGELRTALTSDTAPGFSAIGPSSLEVGVNKVDDRKYDIFLTGRGGKPGDASWWELKMFRVRFPRDAIWEVFPQPPRPVYELIAELDGYENPAVRGFDAWIREDLGLQKYVA